MAPSSSKPALEVADLSVSYGKAVALRGFSMTVAPGEVVAILGPNGAGKTTLLRAIGGALRASSGSIVSFGVELTRMTPWRIATHGVAVVPQGRRCFGSLSVEENLRIGGFHLDRASLRARLDEIEALFPVLRTKRAQDSATLSGGQQQMLAIGRALMSRPRLLLLDEPSLGLSPLLVQEMAETLRQLAGRFDVTIILAEQNTRLALRIASRAYVLQAGRCVREGPSASLASDLHATYLGA